MHITVVQTGVRRLLDGVNVLAAWEARSATVEGALLRTRLHLCLRRGLRRYMRVGCNASTVRKESSTPRTQAQRTTLHMPSIDTKRHLNPEK